MPESLDRRAFLRGLFASTAGLLLPSCGERPVSDRYTEADVETLARQRTREAERAGRGPYGPQRYAGYRGLAELPWFEVDPEGLLRCVADDFPPAIDFHCHLGMSMLFAPDIDLLARTPRVEHLLDCDRAGDGGCPFDLDIYINGNFDEAALDRLWWSSIAQGLWGSRAAKTHTIPNLLAEMDASRVERAVILPIKFGFPFGDDLNERWSAAIEDSAAGAQLLMGASVHPRDPDRVAALEGLAASGARVVKLHPTVQRFFPDEAGMMDVYAACERLGLIVFFHGGRAGIEPESSHPFAMPRHYEGAIADFPKLPFVIGHGGARDAEAMLEMGLRYENAWLGVHGQSVSWLDEMIRRTGGERLLYGTDWPWYPLAATLAKVLIATEERPGVRPAILRTNAEQLLAG